MNKKFDESSLINEIDAIVENSGKAKKIVASTSKWVQIEVDKENSSPEALCGKFAIVIETKYMSGEKETTAFRSHDFSIDSNNELTLEKYDTSKPISKSLLKQIQDHIIGVMRIANDNPIMFQIKDENVITCPQSKILVICEPGFNRHVAELVKDMLFKGEANKHVDIAGWRSHCSEDKGYRWAFLEIERLISLGEAVVVTGDFKTWCDMMPLAVISKMYNADMVIGKAPGKKMSLGDVLDINEVMEHFIASQVSLRQFYKDPYSSIEYFQNIDHTINSMVVFPSILHQFFSR